MKTTTILSKTKGIFLTGILFFKVSLISVLAFDDESLSNQQTGFHGTQSQEVYESVYGNGQQFGYLEYLPVNYDHNNGGYPLIISLHGLDQRASGDQIEFAKIESGGQLAKRVIEGQDFPFIIITPQQPEDVRGRYEGRRNWDPYIIDEVLERVKSLRRVDINRIYLCGESMGGGGVWKYLELFGDKIAAAVPIAGTNTIGNDIVCSTKIRNTPIWAFHCDNDMVVNVQNTLNIVEAINRCNPSIKAKQTIFSSRSHNAWNWAYNFAERTLSSSYESSSFGPVSKTQNIFSWMLSYRLNLDKGNEESIVNDTVSKNYPEENGLRGLRYAYFEGDWSFLPDFKYIIPKKTGIVDSITLDPRLNDDNFGFIFKGNIRILEGGDYTFYVSSDDGSKLFIDDKLVIDNNGTHGNKEKYDSISLTTGMHTIELIYFERLGKEVLEFNYSGPSFNKKPVPSEVLYPGEESIVSLVKPNQAGLHYWYYEGEWTSLPHFADLEPKEEGLVSGFTLEPRKADANFGFCYKGYLAIDQEGEYEFFTASDDGSRLYIDGRLVVDNDGQHSLQERQGKLMLKSGMHAIELRYFERQGREVLDVSYSGPGFSKKSIPSDRLFVEIEHPTLFCDEYGHLPQIEEFIKAYPSHVDNELFIEYTGVGSKNLNLVLYDQYGKTLFMESILITELENLRIDLMSARIPQGLVYLRVEDGANIQIIRLFKQGSL